MVAGLDVFNAYFIDHTDNYILIGGTACDVQLQEKGIDFRRTKDLDIILVVEALTDEFVRHFYGFVKAGGYTVSQSNDKKCFYRFVKPAVDGYPYMMELFSRRPDALPPGNFYLTDIPTSEELSSLSAILMNDAYYQFTIDNCDTIEGLRVASDKALICLKAKAFLNNRQRKIDGHKVQEDDISKHRNDIIRLTVTMAPNDRAEVPETIKTDLRQTIAIMKTEAPDLKSLFKQIGVAALPIDAIAEQIETVFAL